MYSLIFSAVFCFFAGIALLIGANKGKKYKWQYSFARLIVVIISVIASAILSSVISNAIVGTVVVMLLDSGLLSNVFGIDIASIVNDLESGVATIKALGSMIVSPLLFISIFILIKAILNLFVKLITLGILAFTKGNGNVGTQGCVSFMFDKKGQIIIDKEECDMDADDLMMLALDAGAEDFAEEEDSYEIITEPDAFSAVFAALEEAKIATVSAEVTMIPQTWGTLTDEGDIKSMNKILDLLDEDDDVQQVYHNWNG